MLVYFANENSYMLLKPLSWLSLSMSPVPFLVPQIRANFSHPRWRLPVEPGRPTQRSLLPTCSRIRGLPIFFYATSNSPNPIWLSLSFNARAYQCRNQQSSTIQSHRTKFTDWSHSLLRWWESQ